MIRPLAGHLPPAKRAAALEQRLRETWALIDELGAALEGLDTAPDGVRNPGYAFRLRAAIDDLLELRNRPIARRHRSGSTGSPDL